MTTPNLEELNNKLVRAVMGVIYPNNSPIFEWGHEETPSQKEVEELAQEIAQAIQALITNQVRLGSSRNGRGQAPTTPWERIWSLARYANTLSPYKLHKPRDPMVDIVLADFNNDILRDLYDMGWLKHYEDAPQDLKDWYETRAGLGSQGEALPTTDTTLLEGEK